MHIKTGFSIQMRRAARIDENQPDIVSALEAIGCTVDSLAAVGGGVPDLLVGYHGYNLLIEIKNPAKVPSQRKLTPAQITWHGAWAGQKAVIETADEAIAYVRSSVDTATFW